MMKSIGDIVYCLEVGRQNSSFLVERLVIEEIRIKKDSTYYLASLVNSNKERVNLSSRVFTDEKELLNVSQRVVTDKDIIDSKELLIEILKNKI